MVDIKWEDPPEHAVVVGKGHQRGRYAEFATALRERPGKWAVLPSESTSEKGAAATAQNIRRGKVKGFKAGEYETALAGTKIYVRFLQPVEKPEDDELDESDEPDEPDEDETDEDVAARMSLSELTPKVRRWAKAHGHEVPDRGRLPKEIWQSWAEQTGNELPVRAVR